MLTGVSWIHPTALQDTANTVPQKGMRLGPHLKRPPGGNQMLDADYSDLESVELTNGEQRDVTLHS